jgi:hypothetical protein
MPNPNFYAVGLRRLLIDLARAFYSGTAGAKHIAPVPLMLRASTTQHRG